MTHIVNTATYRVEQVHRADGALDWLIFSLYDHRSGLRGICYNAPNIITMSDEEIDDYVGSNMMEE